MDKNYLFFRLNKQMEMARSATITSTPAQLQAGQDVNTLPPPKDITPKSKGLYYF